MIPPLGLPEFAYALIVGLIVGVGFGVRPRFDTTKPTAAFVTHAVWCSMVGAIGLPLMIWVFDPGFAHAKTDYILILMMVAGGGISLLIGTPFAFSISWAISKFRSSRSKQKQPNRVPGSDWLPGPTPPSVRL